MKKLGMLVVAMGFSLAACGGGGDMDKIKALSDKMCACKDKACVDSVREEGKALGEEMRKKYPKKEDAPADLITEYERGEKCRRDLREKLSADKPAPGGEAAPTPAPASAPAAPASAPAK
jgi:hypothetical protein